MPLYHVVLMKPKPDVTQAQLAEFASTAQAMVGKIPGLRSLKSGNPQPSTALRARQFSMAVIAVLEKAEELEAYTNHPVHVSYVNVIVFPLISSICKRKLQWHKLMALVWKLNCRISLHERFENLYEDMLAYDMEFSE